MRCNNSDDLYPFIPRPFTQSTTPLTSAALSNELWHNCLGHLVAFILNYLHRNNFIICNKFWNNLICQFFQSQKEIKLPFYESLFYSLLLFDIVHSDRWTSLTLSSYGNCYYILFLNHFTNFIWTSLLQISLRLTPFFSNFIITLKYNLKNL